MPKFFEDGLLTGLVTLIGQLITMGSSRFLPAFS